MIAYVFQISTMGIKDLWSVLTPFCERKPLYELQDKKVAVDLSCWICEAQNITDYTVQPRMYLRNLYFRTCFLLLLGVHPVFVLEGKAPTMKFDTIAARNAIQFKGARPRKNTTEPKPPKDRTRFHYTLKQCEEMLGCLGLSCVRGNGEAEAMCAYLNDEGLVDGCISQDSDCFAYGARVVYRNFSISSQGAHAASGGAVDVYDLSKVNENMDFGRNKIVALALLCGSDYSDGVFGVGRESAMKFMRKFSDQEILDRLRSWRMNRSLFDEFERKISDKNLCTSCGHKGKLQSHTKSGCVYCATTKGCDFTKIQEERLDIKNELNIRSKALLEPSFPNEELIKEFLVKKDNVRGLNLNWKQPDMVSFVKFAAKYVHWEEVYAFEKFLPILTRWQLLNYGYVKKNLKKVKGLLIPERIKKTRAPKGIPSYEIIWYDATDCFQGLFPDADLVGANLEKFWATIEPQHLVEAAYPELVEAFKESKIKPKKAPKRPKKTPKINDVDCLETMMANSSISEPKVKKTRKIKVKPNVNKIDTYFKQALTNNQKNENEEKESLDVDEFSASSTPIKAQKDILMDLTDNGDNSDLSEIIDGILSQKPVLVENLEKYTNTVDCDFFSQSVTEKDAFEKTFGELTKAIDDSEELVKENYDYIPEEEDSYNDVYIPLIERIKSKQKSTFI